MFAKDNLRSENTITAAKEKLSSAQGTFFHQSLKHIQKPCMMILIAAIFRTENIQMTTMSDSK